MDMVLEGAGTRRGDDEETYEDEDHVYTFMYSCLIESKQQEYASQDLRRRVCSFVPCRENEKISSALKRVKQTSTSSAPPPRQSRIP